MKKSFSIFFLFFTSKGFAAITLYEASKNVMEPMGKFTEVIFNVCYILAIMLLIGTITAFRSYRQNSSQTPISRVIILLLLSIGTALVPIIGKLSSSNIF